MREVISLATSISPPLPERRQVLPRQFRRRLLYMRINTVDLKTFHYAQRFASRDGHAFDGR